MFAYKSVFIPGWVVLLAGFSAYAVAGGAVDDLSADSKRGGFLTASDGRKSGSVDEGSGSMVARLCALTSRSAGQICPPALKGGAGGSAGGSTGAADELSAGLPNLLLNIILREMQNVVVAGTGVDSLGPFEEPWALFKIESAAADDSIPAPAEPGYGLMAPPPGDTWQTGPLSALFQGIIVNGCMGVPATFDLTLDSSVIRSSTAEVFGAVHLVDEVEGWGNYTFEYTIRATDEDGNQSDFIFRGDADAFCTWTAAF